MSFFVIIHCLPDNDPTLSLLSNLLAEGFCKKERHGPTTTNCPTVSLLLFRLILPNRDSHILSQDIKDYIQSVIIAMLPGSANYNPVRFFLTFLFFQGVDSVLDIWFEFVSSSSILLSMLVMIGSTSRQAARNSFPKYSEMFYSHKMFGLALFRSVA